MSIRWKLFLTFFLLTAGATVWVLLIAEREFQLWVKEEVRHRFEGQVGALLESRAERLTANREHCQTLARHEAVRAALRGRLQSGMREEFIREALRLRGSGGRSERGDSPSSRRSLGSGPGIPLVGVIGLDGTVNHIGRKISRVGQRRRLGLAEKMKDVSRTPQQEIAYMVLPGAEGTLKRVQEVVVTPVRDDSEALVGWFFWGLDAETRVEKAFQQTEKLSGREGRSGLIVEGEWFVRGMDRELGERIVERAGEAVLNDKPVEVRVDDKRYLVIMKALNPGAPMGVAYQVVIFPLDALLAAVARLRMAVIALGACTLFAALLVAFYLAKRFSRPIAALVEGTERVRRGDLAGEVKVDSRDEFGALAGAFNAMTQDLALKERYREVLAKVSDPSVAQRLVEGDLELGGEVRKAAVLFCDIRGFTAMTERMDPAEVIALVNEHMTAMTKLVYLHSGVVDKFVGDLVMAVFGVPTSSGHDVEHATRCALQMIAERAQLNASSGRTVEVGIGLAYGELVAGCMGSEDRLNYTVLGDRVNLASRLCNAAGRGEILVDEDVAGAIGEGIQAEARAAIELKGFSEPVAVFALKG